MFEIVFLQFLVIVSLIAFIVLAVFAMIALNQITTYLKLRKREREKAFYDEQYKKKYNNPEQFIG